MAVHELGIYRFYLNRMSNKNDNWSKLFALIKSKGGSWSGLRNVFISQPAYIIVVLSNLAIFFIPGLDLKKQAISLIWIYMMQSILIGVVHVFKLCFYRFTPSDGVSGRLAQIGLAAFFCVHYGFFHFVYSVFIPPSLADWNIVLQGAAIFGFTLILNTIRHYRKENSGNYKAADFMLLPYARIFPIHIAIIFGGMASAVFGNFLPVFVVLAVLKTGFELCLEYFQFLGISFSELQEKGIIENEE
jgi:hypothetical protein